MKTINKVKWTACFLGMVLVMLVTIFEIASFKDFAEEISQTERVFGTVMIVICLPTVVWLWNKTDKYEEEKA